MTGSVAPLPIALFALIFFWTPPHFWSLALFVRMDYANAGIPMLPVVSGEAVTRRQILFYTAIMAVAALAPVLLSLTGPIYGVTALVATGVFAAMALQVGLRREADPARMGRKSGCSNIRCSISSCSSGRSSSITGSRWE